MTDEEYVFRTDSKEKKRIAGQAKYRKGTSNRKGCILPSDYLTKKQIEERNGPIMTVKLDAPMKWEEFTELSATLKLEYLNYLKEKYHPSVTDLSLMFGVGDKKLRTEFQKLHFSNGGFNGGARQGSSWDARVKAWQEFLGATEEKETDEEKETVIANTDIEKGAVSYKPQNEPSKEDENDYDPDLSYGNVNFLDTYWTGNAEEFAMFVTSMKMLLKKDKKYRVTLKIETLL